MRHMVQTWLHYSYLTGRSNSTPAAIISRNLRISFLCISSNLDDLSSWQQILSLKYQTWVAENSLPYFVLHTIYVEYKLSREFWWFQNYSFFKSNLKKKRTKAPVQVCTLRVKHLQLTNHSFFVWMCCVTWRGFCLFPVWVYGWSLLKY